MKNSILIRISTVFLILIFFKALPALATAYTPTTLPDPKSKDLSSWIADPDQILTTTEKNQLNRRLNDLSAKIEMGIVIVNEIAPEFTPKQFATNVFNLWGIGKKKLDNGLLLLVVVEQKRWEIETGYGLEGEWPDVVVKRLGEENLVPAFKEKKWAEGLSKIIDKFSFNVKQNLPSENRPSAFPNSSLPQPWKSTNEAPIWSNWKAPLEIDHLILLTLFLLPTFVFYIYRKFKPSHFVWQKKTLFLYPAVGLTTYLFVGMTCYFGFAATSDIVSVFQLMAIFLLINSFLLLVFFIIAFIQVLKYSEVSKRLEVALGFFSKHSLFFLGSAGFWGIPLVDRLIRYARFSDHECSHCLKTMKSTTDLITGNNEDNFLDRWQKLEQNYGGLDYDVWKCSSCRNLSLYPIKLEKEGIENCPACQRRTFKYIRSQVLIAASANHPGKGCSEFRCGSCQHQIKNTYEIPAISINRGSSSGHHGSVGGGTSGGSGSGWGGGRSGGGGAGGSW